MEKKYQVFISSTYQDLIEERKKALDVLLMADCFPAGMEAFVATDLAQFEVIKKVIDLCDYYVLIIGKKYGSVNPNTGISYTEMEYDYAISKGIPVLVFALDMSVELPPEKCESDATKIEKFQAFRDKAMTNRLATVWKTIDGLTGALAVSIMKAKSEIVRPGWQRGTDYDEASLRREIMSLDDENKKLKAELKEKNETIQSLTEQSDLAFEDYPISIPFHYYINAYNLKERQRKNDTFATSLVQLFTIIAVEMMDVAITEVHVEKTIIGMLPRYGTERYLSDNQFTKKILNQFKALGFVYSNWNNEKNQLYWGLTKKGEKLRNDLTLFRKDK